MKRTFDLKRFTVTVQSTIREAMQVIDKQARGIALLVNSEGRLEHTITDGDIRRAILEGTSLETPVSDLLARKASSPYPTPMMAAAGTDRAVLLKLMQDNTLRQLPLTDERGVVVDLVTLGDLLPEQPLPVKAVIMAGGFGKRLAPLTDDLPKPMLPVGGRPLIERTVEQLRESGIKRINITTHYKPEKITEHFGDGDDFGVEIKYLAEERPLGTAGALGLMETPEEPLLVINGDILTSIDYRSLFDYHREHEAELTIGVRQYRLQVPYGVVEGDGSRVQCIREKPEVNFLINAGIYLLEPSVLAHVHGDQRIDMTTLIETLIADGRRVVSYPVVEYWLDIGQHDEYEQAQTDIEAGE